MRVLLAVLLTLAGAALVIWLLAPREEARLLPVTVDLPADLSGWLAEREAAIDPDLAARIEWADAPDAQTEIAIVYLHGFSASPREIAPVPQHVAKALGANLFLARLTGHGQDGAALATASAEDWWRDTAEALAVGQRLGRRVVVIGTFDRRHAGGRGRARPGAGAGYCRGGDDLGQFRAAQSGRGASGLAPCTLLGAADRGSYALFSDPECRSRQRLDQLLSDGRHPAHGRAGSACAAGRLRRGAPARAVHLVRG